MSATSVVSFASIVASIETGHWFATPFAALFMTGYSYVAGLVIHEQLGHRREAAAAGKAAPLALDAEGSGEVEAPSIARAA